MPIRPSAKRKLARDLDGARNRIEHVVVLMLENRSFDHLFGFLDHPKRGREFTGLTVGEYPNPLDTTRLRSPGVGVDDSARHILQRDPPHSHFAAKQQLNARRPWRGFRMNGFVTAYGLKLAGKEHLPFIHWWRIYGALALVSAVVAAALGDFATLLHEWVPFVAGVFAVGLALIWLARRLETWLQPRPWVMWCGVALITLFLVAGVQGSIHRLRSGPGNFLAFWIPVFVLLQAAGQVKRLQFNRGIRAAVAPAELGRASKRIMRCMAPEQLPVLATLAKEFAVCTHWHSSVPGATWPNRNFAHAATSDQSVDIEIGFYNSKTIFELLDEAHNDDPPAAPTPWRVYHDGMPQLTAFPNLWIDDESAARWFPISELRAHAGTGDLALYSFIEPRHSGGMTNSQHAGNNERAGDETTDGTTDFVRGERLVKYVYDALKGVLDKTMLVITYDEHGGFFDHEHPPRAKRPTPVDARRGRTPIGLLRRLVACFVQNKNSPFDFRRVGVRVPAVVVSAWIPPGWVDPTPYDHTAVIATVRKLFAPRARPLTQRDRAARSLHHLVLRSSTARYPLPDVPDPPLDTGDAAQPVPDPPHSVRTAAGSAPRPRRLFARTSSLGNLVDRARVPWHRFRRTRVVSPDHRTVVAADLREQLEALAARVDEQLDSLHAPSTPQATIRVRPTTSELVGERFARFAERNRPR